jgi:hypothetical protein
MAEGQFYAIREAALFSYTILLPTTKLQAALEAEGFV